MVARGPESSSLGTVPPVRHPGWAAALRESQGPLSPQPSTLVEWPGGHTPLFASLPSPGPGFERNTYDSTEPSFKITELS